MVQAAELILICALLSSLWMLGSAMLTSCIRLSAFQGVALGLLPIALHPQAPSARIVLIATGMVAIKGCLIPHYLQRAIRDSALRKETDPLIGFNLSLVLGIALLSFAFSLSASLPLPESARSSLLVPVSLSMVMIGLLLIISRAKLLSQTLGYLVLENGIFVFGLTLSEQLPGLLEIGILLDVFVGVFIMGAVIHHVQQTFGSLSSYRLSELKE